MGFDIMQPKWTIAVLWQMVLNHASKKNQNRSAINDVPAFFPPLGVASVARSLQHDHKGRCR